jgi:hypothetical protein
VAGGEGDAMKGLHSTLMEIREEQDMKLKEFLESAPGKTFLSRSDSRLHERKEVDRELALVAADRVIAALATCIPPITGLSRSLIADAIEDK